MTVKDSQWHPIGDTPAGPEQEGLDGLRRLLPDSTLTHAWLNVEIRDRNNNGGEVDAIVLHANGLYVIELKGWSGRVTGDPQNWTQSRNGVVKHFRNPWIGTNSKAKILKTLLAHELNRHRDGRLLTLPRVQAIVVMHGQGSQIDLPEEGCRDVYALDGFSVQGLPPFSERLSAAPATSSSRMDQPKVKALIALMGRIGLRPRPVLRQIGAFQIERDGPVLGQGPGWIDVSARHHTLKNTTRRVRLFQLPPSPTPAQRRDVGRMARREYGLTEQLNHAGVLRPRDIYDSDEGPALVFDDDSGRTPMREFLKSGPDAATRLSLIRQIGEVVDYAHRHGVTHRGLSPSAVWVETRDGQPHVTVRNWQPGVSSADVDSSATLHHGITEVNQAVALDEWMYLAPEAHQSNPEGEPLDVFGMGALAYLILTDHAPATNLAELMSRLSEGGLDPAVSRDALAPALCALVRHATAPTLTERTLSAADFLEELTRAQGPSAGTAERAPAPDPRTAEVGTMVARRWEVKERLGSGSSGVALLVDDYESGAENLVLKVATDESVADRIRAEAEVMARLDHPRILKLIEGPMDVEGHTAILLEDAGRPTLARRLADEGRLTLEQLTSYGADLFEAVNYLESEGVFHRDLKPGNIGVRESRSDRRRHLTLFDFSLSSAPLEDTGSGTRGYVDPFLRVGTRRRFDSAAERFALASTLYEMATGRTVEFGDGMSDPVVTGAHADLAASQFEPEVSESMLAFFSRALAPNLADRFDDLTSMAQAWERAFPSSSAADTPERDEAERAELARRATLTTPLEQSGLTALAVSAARRLGAHTVEELLDTSGVRINREPGLGVKVRAELQRHRQRWRALRSTSVVEDSTGVLLRGVETTLEALVPGSRSKAFAQADLARRLLNLSRTESASSWPDLRTAADECGLTGDPGEALDALTKYWSATRAMKDLLPDVTDALATLGGVATADEIAGRLIAVRGSNVEGDIRRANALGLVRAAVEADAGATLTFLRHGDSVLITGVEGVDPDRRLQAAAALADDVDRELADAGVPLGPGLGLDLVRSNPMIDELELVDPGRALALAARASRTGALSPRSELYPRGMGASAVVATVLASVPRMIGADRLRALGAARFPAADEVPDRPELDQLVAEAPVGLTWKPDARAYVRAADSSLLTSATSFAPAQPPVRYDTADEAIRAAIDSRAAAVLTTSPVQVRMVADGLAVRYGLRVVDVTAELLRAMRATARTAGVDWSLVLRADASEQGSGDRTSLDRLVDSATDSFWADVVAAPEPLLLVEADPLARYGQVARLAEMLDLATPRPAARLLLVAKRAGAAAPTLDGGVSIPMAAPTYIDLQDQGRRSA